MSSLLLGLLLNVGHAEELSDSETTYAGASILKGDEEVYYNSITDLDNQTTPDNYAFFEGNTLYVGAEDNYGNTVDGIVEFYWFHSSVDRGSDFYVAVIKARSTPGNNCGALGRCSLWSDGLADWGEAPVLSVEAMTDISREQGAFRWDWSVPFESYGIDAYGQITFGNQYGLSANAEGAAMSGVELPEGTNINGVPVEGDANIQVKGYAGSEYRVQTQYNVTLFEWDVFVNGRANLMAWDMYLNLSERDDQSAYHEYFLAIQVEEGQAFMMDELNILANFDTGWWNPFRQEVGLSIKGLQIYQPVWEPTIDDSEPAVEPSEEPIEEDTGIFDDTGLEDTGYWDVLDENKDQAIDTEMSEPIKGCSTMAANPSLIVWLMMVFGLGFVRRN